MTFRRASSYTLTALSITLVGFTAAAAQAHTALALAGRWLSGYNSLCDVEPERSPAAAWLQPGAGLTVVGCEDLKARDFVPLVIIVKNSDKARAAKLTLPLLSDVVVLSQRRDSAAALYVPWERRGGFATELHGAIDIEVGPGAHIELIYLLPAAAVRQQVAIKGFPPFKPAGP